MEWEIDSILLYILIFKRGEETFSRTIIPHYTRTQIIITYRNTETNAQMLVRPASACRRSRYKGAVAAVVFQVYKLRLVQCILVEGRGCVQERI